MQLALDLFHVTKRHDPATCPHIRAMADISGGKAKCGAYGDGETWTNCVTACVNLADRAGIRLDRELAVVEEKNHARGRYEHN